LILEAQPPQNGSFILYKVDDGTGCIDVKHWVNSDANSSVSIKEGSYARIVGNLKSVKRFFYSLFIYIL
jgi:hypothetical protein